MAINKNFVVKNGLEVNTQLIYADGDTNKVGIASTAPNVELDVRGGIAASNTTVAGVSTVLTALRVGNQEGRVLTILAGSGQTAVGIGTTIPEFLLDVRSYDGTGTGKTAMHVYGDVRITGDLSMDDLTLDNANLTSLVVTGMSTFQDDVAHEGSRVGVTSFLWDSTEDSLEFLDHTKLTFGDDKDLQIYHDASESLIQHNGGGDLRVKTAGASENLYIDSAHHAAIRTSGTENAVYCTKDEGVSLYYNNGLKFETTSTGILVTGISTFSKFVDINESADISGGLNVTGFSTFTKFVDINESVDIAGGLKATGITTVGLLSVTDRVDTGKLHVAGLSTFGAAVQVNAHFDATGHVNAGDNSVINGELRIAERVWANDDLDVDKDLYIAGVSTFTKFVDINESADIAGGIAVTGLSTFTGNVDVNSDVDINRSLAVTGGSTVTGLSTFTGGALIAGISTHDAQGIRLAGVMTATKYYGDGNGLYGVVAETSYAVVSGMATVAMGLTAGISLEGVAVTGVSTFQYVNVTGICSAKGGINIGSGVGATIFNPSGSGNEMTFGTNNVERMRFTSDGKTTFGPYGSNERGPFVQISRGQGFDKGTLNPSTCFLHLGGKDNASSLGHYAIGFGYIYGNPATTAPAYISYEDRNTTSYTYGDLTFWTKDATTANVNAIERIRIKSGGRVGIGTTIPGTNFHLFNSGVCYAIIETGHADYNPMIEYKNADRRWQAGLFGDDADGYSIKDITAGATRVHIDTDGYVGITSTNPTVRLDISSNDANIFKMDAGSANGGGMSIYHQNTVKGYFGVAGSNYLSSSSANDIVLRAENRLDVAVSNTKKLDVNGGGINVSGICTATSFAGDGSALTGTTGKSIAMAIVFG